MVPRGAPEFVGMDVNPVFKLVFGCENIVSWTQINANFGDCPREPTASGLLFQIGSHCVVGTQEKLESVVITYNEHGEENEISLEPKDFRWMDVYSKRQRNVSPIDSKAARDWLWPGQDRDDERRNRKIHCRSNVQHILTFWPEGWKVDAPPRGDIREHRKLIFSASGVMNLSFGLRWDGSCDRTLHDVSRVRINDGEGVIEEHGTKQDPPWPGGGG